VTARVLSAWCGVAILAISQQEFDDLGLPDSCRSLWNKMYESGWYRDDAGAALGVILFNPETGYWGYVMCARVDGGDFKRLGVGADFTSLAMAQRDLKTNMERQLARKV
jgi:hypothetical protein